MRLSKVFQCLGTLFPLRKTNNILRVEVTKAKFGRIEKRNFTPYPSVLLKLPNVRKINFFPCCVFLFRLSLYLFQADEV